MRYFFHTFALLLLTQCGGDTTPYPNLADGPSADYKPPITLEAVRSELADMQRERPTLKKKKA